MAARRDALRKQAREGLCYGVWVTLGTALGLGLLQSSVRYTGDKSVPMLVALASALELAGSSCSSTFWPCSSALRYLSKWDSHQTLWFGVHMTVVTVLPLILAGGHTSLGALQRTIVDQKFCEVPLDWIQRWGSRGALLGAWLGAIALVLDWDRPWQQWPTPCVVGSLLLRGPSIVVASCILVRQ
ncbi:hypothetical protein V5799_003532 [Amblyomma americanum]|uniref:Uncharacterized protein n=1 Tax=Amblyomma americanum TaxID=6943 RepID=A0AAQ4D8P4_AMBAM